MGINRKLQFAVHAALAAAAASAVVPIAMAQTAPQKSSTVSANGDTDSGALEEVVVTGSRLQLSPNDVSISPVTSVTAVDIAQTGLIRAEDVLNQLPQVIAENSGGQSISSNGIATVSLRGLGSERTLVLVDGNRLAPGAGLGTSYASSSDLNQIPADLIERVDVLTGGASSVYGADAVAGVVNFVLNTHFEGVRLDANYGFGRHDNNNATELGYLSAANQTLPQSVVDAGFSKDVSFLAGSNFADGKGNATVYFTYTNTSPAVGYQYDYAGCTLNTPDKLPGPGGLKCGGSSSSATGRFLLLGNVGTSAYSTLADKTVDAKTGAFRSYNGATDSYNYGALSYLQRGSERYTAGSFLHYDIDDHTNVYSEFMFARNYSHAQYGPSGEFAFGTPVISCSNPLLTPGELAALCSPANIAANQATYGPENLGANPLGGNPRVTGNNILLYLARRSVESGPRTDTYQSNSFREVLGVKGDIVDGITYDAHAQVGITQMHDDEGGFLGQNQINNALNVVTNPTTGQPACAAALNGDDPACVPWNIYSPGGVTAAQLKYLEVESTYSITTTEYIANASVTADLGKYGLQIPWASSGMQVNVGSEFREERYDFAPDYIFANGLASGGDGVQPAIDGSFHVGEGFTELRLPIINDKLGAYDLAFEGGYRYSDYTSGFTTNTYKFGLEWAPVKDVRFRGGYNRAVRAPNIGDLYSPSTVGAGGTSDPCWGTAVNGLVQGHTLAFCENTGVTAGEFGHILTNPAAQINTSTGGSQALTPEIADTYTFGFVVSPSAIPALTASFDFYDIKIRNTIESLQSSTIINDCGATGLASLCDLIHRGGGTGSLWFNSSDYVNTDEENIGTITTRGVDVAGHYGIGIGSYGKLGFNFSGTEVINYDTQPLPGISGSYNCAGYFGTICQSPTPRWRHNLTTDWATPWSGLDVSLRWRYIGGVSTDRSSQNSELAQTYFEPTSHIGSYTYLDLSASASLPAGISVRVGVNNITDKSPPIVASGTYSDCPNNTCNANTWVGTYDTLGRYLYAHVTAKF
jgi:outer membrane receptor protein involved in Fe transport